MLLPENANKTGNSSKIVAIIHTTICSTGYCLAHVEAPGISFMHLPAPLSIWISPPCLTHENYSGSGLTPLLGPPSAAIPSRPAPRLSCSLLHGKAMSSFIRWTWRGTQHPVNRGLDLWQQEIGDVGRFCPMHLGPDAIPCRDL